MAHQQHQFDDKKAHLKTLISAIGAKEVDCRVKLTIHTVTNLPVLDGSFRVRWKFRDIDGKIAKQQKKEMEKRSTADASYGLTAALGVAASLAGSSVASSVPSTSALAEKQKNADLSTDERGTTPYRTLRARDHTVTFEHTVDVVAHMRIVKGELIGEPLKLVVERRMEESEVIGTNKKFEPRVGHKYIDLAEFVNEGKVKRKFLLERSKTNAMVTVSLDIITTKQGIEFKKPALRQDHLLIGRKEPIRALTSEKAIARINTANFSGTLKPSLTRASSTTSTTSSSAVSKNYSRSHRSLATSKTETEAVIEALFNPTIFFTASPAATPAGTPAVSPVPSTFDEAASSKPKSLIDTKKKKKDSISAKSEADVIREEVQDVQIAQQQAKKHSKKDSTNSITSDPNRRPSLAAGKTILDVALELNQQMDRDKTLRPKLTPLNSDSWEYISFPNGSQGLNRKMSKPTHPPHAHRMDTGDSLATDFSTTSTRQSTSGSTSPEAMILSSRHASSPSSGLLPSISIIAETPTTATPENSSTRGKWYKRFRKTSFESSSAASRSGSLAAAAERRATTPTPPVSSEFGVKASSSRPSEEFNLSVPPSVKKKQEKGILGGGVGIEDPEEMNEAGEHEQLTPTPTKGA